MSIPKDCVKRLMNDIKQLGTSPLDEHGIYYKHDEENILKGYALIVGGEDTPYFGGYYFFVFNFPSNYPYSPPRVDFCTNDGRTRFNPNLYTNKKTCLSLLNTWKGENWTSCQTISSVLLSLTTVLCKNPLLNEPHVTPSHKDFHNYNHSIEYANIDTAICDILLKKSICYPFFDAFDEIMEEQFKKNASKLIEFCEEKSKLFEGIIVVGLYHMTTRVDYKKTLEKLLFLKNKLN